MFVHHVYFWLQHPERVEDRAALVAGLRKLSKVGTIRQHHIGVPAATDRGVIDNSYSVSWMLIFDTPEDQDSYQVDPIHLQFVKECSPLWSKVVVYDSIDA
ncbi:Dabb family protein [Flavitalea sp. BT771]|uniref:Dabb family protein n=1 Tax=Flavitalea sp. BT771 TaxID=3063329 RepID=UPI0026E3028D|nr:Dabb family protein [Flavitalea sp. BT771]MDO6434378.1 Dabb family protein [Flavitalea sp. BT771]MDV6223278.1 Dabb family protein [Flavitalea sp. BT771]